MKRFYLVLTGAVLVMLFDSCAMLSNRSSAPIHNKEKSTAVRMANCDGPALSLPPELRLALKPRTGEMVPDDHWADLAERIPGGFAGILYDRNMKPILMLTDPARSTEVKKLLVSDRTCRHFDLVGAQVLKARWDFAQLVDWFNFFVSDTSVWKTEGIVFGDKDEETNRVYFRVETEAGRQRLIEKLSALNIPCDLVRIGIGARAVRLDPQVIPPLR
jgi:hypothetical protein